MLRVRANPTLERDALRDVRRSMSTSILHRSHKKPMSTEAMLILLQQFLKKDSSAEAETKTAMLNEKIAADLGDAWSLLVSALSFTSISAIIHGTDPADDNYSPAERLFVPQWSDLMELRESLVGGHPSISRIGAVIPQQLQPLFEECRIDIPILLPRAKNLFWMQVIGMRGATMLKYPAGCAVKLFQRCQWIALLLSSDKHRCEAFSRAYGGEDPASLEQLRLRTRILKHAAYLPGYHEMESIPEADMVEQPAEVIMKEPISARIPLSAATVSCACAPEVKQQVEQAPNMMCDPVVSSPESKVPRPDVRKVMSGTPVWVPGYVKTALGKLAHPIPLDSGSSLSLISANLEGTFFGKENVEPRQEVLVMGVDGESIPIRGSVRLWFSLPDWKDVTHNPLVFEDQLFVIDGLGDLILLGNELISRAQLNIQPANVDHEWIIQSPLEPYTVIRGFSDERECIPTGAFYRIRTKNGVKLCQGRKPVGFVEPEVGVRTLRPSALTGLVAMLRLKSFSIRSLPVKRDPLAKYKLEQSTDAKPQPAPIPYEPLPSNFKAPQQMLDPIVITAEQEKQLIDRFGLKPFDPTPADEEVAMMLADEKMFLINPEVPDIIKLLTKSIILRYSNVISTSRHPLGCITDGPHFKVRLRGHLPVYYQQSYTSQQREEMKPLVQQLYDLDVLTDSPSATFACRVRVVHRVPGDKGRLVTNYRPVNNITMKDIYPIALTTENIKWLREVDPRTGFPRCNFMCDFDANKAYHQVLCADQETKDALAMALPDGIAACNRMPFGPCNAPGHWSRVCDKVLGPYKWTNFTNFYDNLHCAGSTLFDGLWNTALLFERMEQHGMTVSLDKCHFFIAGSDC